MRKRDGLRTVVLLVAGMAFFLHPMRCLAEFYRYVTRDGVVHYVGDRSLVPEEYQQEVKTKRSAGSSKTRGSLKNSDGIPSKFARPRGYKTDRVIILWVIITAVREIGILTRRKDGT